MKFSMFLLMSFSLLACTPTTKEDLRLEGEAETRKLAQELKAIDTKEDLIRALPRLKRRYNRLAELIVAVRKCGEKGGEASAASEELFVELARIYEFPGGRELVESAQEEAIHRLDSRLKTF